MTTTEERDARNTLERLKVKVDVLIGQIEDTLATIPISVSALQKRIESAGKAWNEFEGQYDKMRTSAGDKRVQDQVRAEQDHTQHADFQRRYYDVLARADDALINDEQCRQDKRNAEDACLKELKDAEDVHLKALASEEEARLKELKNAEDVCLKALKVWQYIAKWKAAHHCIDVALEEIKTSLEGTAIDSLEVLKVKKDQLMQVKESLKESASLMDSIITEDPEQTDAMTDAEATKSVQAVSKISACEERIAMLRATINKTSSTGTPMPASAIAESPTAPSTRSAPTGP